MIEKVKDLLTRFFGSLAERIAVVICALIFSQAPQFMYSYLHELNGSLDAYEKSVQKIDAEAQKIDMSRQEFLNDLKSSRSKSAQASYETHYFVIKSWENTKLAIQKLKNSSLWVKPFVFIRMLDKSLFEKTRKDFKPGFVFSLETFLYMVAGIIVGMLLFRIVTWIPKKILGRKSV